MGARPRLLDLFCGAGGAAMGYHRAGFEVVGVDNRPQPRYPFEFIQADGLGFPLDGFDAIHAAPMWLQYARTGNAHHVARPDEVTAIAERLRAAGSPYVCESGSNGPLLDTVMICGASLGLQIVRHMFFETNVPLLVPPCAHPRNGTVTGALVAYGAHSVSRARYGRAIPPRRTMREWVAAAELGWMTQAEASLASPPAYTEHIGHYLLAEINARRTSSASNRR